MVVWNVVRACSALVVSTPLPLESVSPVVSDSGGSVRFVVVAARGGSVGAVVSLLAGPVPVALAGGGGLLAVGPFGSGGGDVMVVMGVRR